MILMLFSSFVSDLLAERVSTEFQQNDRYARFPMLNNFELLTGKTIAKKGQIFKILIVGERAKNINLLETGYSFTYFNKTSSGPVFLECKTSRCYGNIKHSGNDKAVISFSKVKLKSSFNHKIGSLIGLVLVTGETVESVDKNGKVTKIPVLEIIKTI